MNAFQKQIRMRLRPAYSWKILLRLRPDGLQKSQNFPLRLPTNLQICISLFLKSIFEIECNNFFEMSFWMDYTFVCKIKFYYIFQKKIINSHADFCRQVSKLYSFTKYMFSKPYALGFLQRNCFSKPPNFLLVGYWNANILMLKYYYNNFLWWINYDIQW